MEPKSLQESRYKIPATMSYYSLRTEKEKGQPVMYIMVKGRPETHRNGVLNFGLDMCLNHLEDLGFKVGPSFVFLV